MARLTKEADRRWGLIEDAVATCGVAALYSRHSQEALDHGQTAIARYWAALAQQAAEAARDVVLEASQYPWARKVAVVALIVLAGMGLALIGWGQAEWLTSWIGR